MFPSFIAFQSIYSYIFCLWWMIVCVGGIGFLSVTELVCFHSACWVLISTICRNWDLWWRWLGPQSVFICVFDRKRGLRATSDSFVCVWVALIEGNHNDSVTGCVSTCLPNAWLQGKHFYLVLKKALPHTLCCCPHYEQLIHTDFSFFFLIAKRETSDNIHITLCP